MFVHAGIRPDKFIKEQDTFDMLIIRDNFINNKHKLKYTVIFEHTTFKKSYSEDNIRLELIPDVVNIHFLP